VAAPAITGAKLLKKGLKNLNVCTRSERRGYSGADLCTAQGAIPDPTHVFSEKWNQALCVGKRGICESEHLAGDTARDLREGALGDIAAADASACRRRHHLYAWKVELRLPRKIFKPPWHAAGPLNPLADKAESDQLVVSKGLYLSHLKEFNALSSRS